MLIVKPSRLLMQYLKSHNLDHLRDITLDDQEFSRALGEARKQHPEETIEELGARAQFRLIWERYKHPVNVRRWKGIKLAATSLRLQLAIIVGLILFFIFCCKAHAQIDVIQWQNSAGNPIKTYAAPFKIKCNTNLTCTPSGSVMTLDASSTASTAFSSLTASANSNLGTFSASGNTWDFSAATVFKFKFGASSSITNTGTAGQALLSNADGTATFSDPLVSGAAAHDAAGAAINPVAIGCYGNAAAPADVSADVDITRAWCLRNGSLVINLATAGTLYDARSIRALTSSDVVTAAQPTAANLNAQVVGNVASGASDSGNPVKSGGVFNTTQPTVTTGQRVDFQATSRGAQIVAPGVDGFTVTANAGSGTFNIQGNASVNVAQIAGNATLTGNGVTGTGSQRVTVASDNSDIPIKISQTTPGTTNGVRSDASGAIGSAPPARAEFNGYIASGATGGLMQGAAVGDTYKAINISTATTTLIVTGVSGRQVRITAFHMLTQAANNVAWIEGTGATCGTGTAGMAGGTTAASGYNFAANGGMTHGSGLGTVLATVTAGDSVCIVTSAATQLSGGLSYAIY